MPIAIWILLSLFCLMFGLVIYGCIKSIRDLMKEERAEEEFKKNFKDEDERYKKMRDERQKRIDEIKNKL